MNVQEQLGRKANGMAMAGSILLHQRCKHLGSLLFNTGLVLDLGGATDRAISALARLGACAATTSLHQKKKAMELHHEKRLKETILQRKVSVVHDAFQHAALVPVLLYSTKPSQTVYFIRALLNCTPCTVGSSVHECPSSVHEPQWDIYGDNVDHRVHAYHMTKEARGSDIHWFVLVGAPLRVTPPPHLDNTRPRRPILEVPNSDFVPSLDDNRSLRDSFVFHVLEVLVREIPFLKQYAKLVPEYIDHPYVSEMSQKSDYCILDLLDKNESKSDDIIEILEYIHKFIAQAPTSESRTVLERLVFGGDVLTNERSYQGQLDLANGTSETERKMGVLLRPEGLHLCMNFCKYIVENFHTPSSAKDPGTMYNQKVNVDRKDLKTDMTQGYNQCRHFVNDDLDGHIVAATMQYFGMKSLEDKPTRWGPSPLFPMLGADLQLEQITAVAEYIVEHVVLYRGEDVATGIQNVDTDVGHVDEAGRHCCPFGGCEKTYKEQHWLKRHMRNVHNVVIDLVAAPRKEADESYDGVFNHASAFMKVALLFRDLVDSYHMGDGDRLFRDLKYLMLHFDMGHHVKYRLWTWRMMAYDTALLSERERFVYRNNASINLVGKTRKCIANDHLVEIHVHRIKQALRAMGANVTYQAARRAAKCMDAVNELTDKLASHRSGEHATTDRSIDVQAMAMCLSTHEVFTHTPGREHSTFPNQSADLLQNINLVAVNTWIGKQKARADREMQVT